MPGATGISDPASPAVAVHAPDGRARRDVAWRPRDPLDELVAAGQRSITGKMPELRFTEFIAGGIVVEAMTRIRQVSAEVAVFSPSSGAYRVLKRVGLTAGAVGAR